MRGKKEEPKACPQNMGELRAKTEVGNTNPNSGATRQRAAKIPGSFGPYQDLFSHTAEEVVRSKSWGGEETRPSL